MYIEFKHGEKHAAKGADISESHDSFRDCGYLLEDDEVVIDIDCLPKDTIEKIIQWFDVDTQVVWTDRGAHLYFRKGNEFYRCRNGVCKLGFPIEMKAKSNSPRGITIKRNGVLRQIDNEGKRQDLPHFFSNRNHFENLYGLDEGDGRNQKLFAHKMQLKNCKGWEKILNFINTFIFAEPLPKEEYETVTRSQKIDGSDFNENMVSELMINEYQCTIYANKIWFMHKGEYVDDLNLLKRLIYSKCEKTKTKFVDEVLKQIEYKAPYVGNDTIFDIRFNNGVLSQGKWKPINSMAFTPYTISIDYDEDCEPVELVDKYIDSLTDGEKEYRELLLEALAFPLIVDPEKIRTLGKFFMFRGDGANGKGTLLQIMRKIYQPKNCTALSIKQLVDDRFKVTLRGKLVNLGDDIEAEAINNDQLKVLKNITTCDTASTRQLYKQSEDVTFTTKLFFTTNSDIKSFEKGYAYKRRILWMPMFNTIEKPDPRFITKITTPEALEYWIKLIIEGYIRLYEKGEWTESEKVNDYNARYHEHNNQMKLFISEIGADTLVHHTIKEIKDMYNDWNDEDNRPFNNKMFKTAIWESDQMGFGIKKTGVSTTRILLKKNETDQNIRPDFK